MVFRFMKQGWRTKPSVSDDAYFRLFEGALFRVYEHRDLQTIHLAYGLVPGSDPSDDVVRAVFQEALNEFTAVESEVRNLEEVRPRSKDFMDVHVAAIGFLRGFLLYHDRFISGAAKAAQGDDRQARKRRKEAEGWARSLEEAHHLLRGKLTELERQRPSVIIEMKLSPSLLQDLGLRD